MLFNYFLKIWKLSGFLKQQPHHDYELLIKVDSIGIFCGCHFLLTFTLGWVVVVSSCMFDEVEKIIIFTQFHSKCFPPLLMHLICMKLNKGVFSNSQCLIFDLNIKNLL